MKKLNQRINWYKYIEDRKWKRIYHCVEIGLVVLIGIVNLGVLNFYGNGQSLQSVISLFLCGVIVASIMLVPATYKPFFQRWHIFALTLSLGSAMALAIIASLLALELQWVNA